MKGAAIVGIALGLGDGVVLVPRADELDAEPVEPDVVASRPSFLPSLILLRRELVPDAAQRERVGVSGVLFPTERRLPSKGSVEEGVAARTLLWTREVISMQPPDFSDDFRRSSATCLPGVVMSGGFDASRSIPLLFGDVLISPALPPRWATASPGGCSCGGFSAS